MAFLLEWTRAIFSVDIPTISYTIAEMDLLQEFGLFRPQNTNLHY